MFSLNYKPCRLRHQMFPKIPHLSLWQCVCMFEQILRQWNISCRTLRPTRIRDARSLARGAQTKLLSLRTNSCRLSHLPVPKTKTIGLAPSSVQRWIRHAQDKLYALHGVSRKNRFQYSSDCMMMWMSSSSSFNGDRLALLLYIPFSSRRSMVWCLWFCARGWCFKRPNTSDLPRSKLLALPKIKKVGYLVLGF